MFFPLSCLWGNNVVTQITAGRYSGRTENIWLDLKKDSSFVFSLPNYEGSGKWSYDKRGELLLYFEPEILPTDPLELWIHLLSSRKKHVFESGRIVGLYNSNGFIKLYEFEEGDKTILIDEVLQFSDFEKIHLAEQNASKWVRDSLSLSNCKLSYMLPELWKMYEIKGLLPLGRDTVSKSVSE